MEKIMQEDLQIFINLDLEESEYMVLIYNIWISHVSENLWLPINGFSDGVHCPSMSRCKYVWRRIHAISTWDAI